VRSLLRGGPLLALYGLILLHWVLFINYGTSDFYSFDWYLIHQWLDVAKLALVTHQIPYEVTLWSDVGPHKDLFGTKYFGMPFLILSPQVVLLRWVSIQAFATIQIILTMTVGFYALVMWKRRLHLSDFSASVLILMWSLNGALVSRMGVGHVQLTGYFLIPAFLYGLNMLWEESARPEEGERERCVRSALLMSCFLLVVLLQGSVHTVYQMALILGLFSLVFRRSFKYVMLALGVFALMAAYFIVPNVMYGAYSLVVEGDQSRQALFCSRGDLGCHRTVFGGYGTDFETTLQAVTGITLPDVSLSNLRLGNAVFFVPVALFSIVSHLILALVYPFSAWFDGSWEYSVYVGPVGLLLMVVGWVGFTYGSDAPGRYILGGYRRHVTLTAIVFALSLSVTSGVLWMALPELVGLSPVDQVPTRMLLYPLLVSWLCMSVGLDRVVDRLRVVNRLWLKGLVLTTLTLTLLLHSSMWSFHRVSMISPVVEATGRQEKPFFSTSIIEVGDSAYRTAVNAGFLVSFLAIVGVVAMVVSTQRLATRTDGTAQVVSLEVDGE
jgi:hypothetical protein